MKLLVVTLATLLLTRFPSSTASAAFVTPLLVGRRSLSTKREELPRLLYNSVSWDRSKRKITNTRCSSSRAPAMHRRSRRGEKTLASSSMALSPILVPPIALVLGLFVASVVNALQGGVRGDLGLTPEDILGVSSEDATAEHIEKLGKADFIQLFYASRCPTAQDLDGEYRARLLKTGIMYPVFYFLTHRIWGPGQWLGKGICAGRSEGYNLFSSSMNALELKGLPKAVRRSRRFLFSLVSESVFDKGESSTLNYGEGSVNGPLFGGVRDEIRRVNDRLFVGLGYIQAFGGKYNTAPFILEAPPVDKFLAPDEE